MRADLEAKQLWRVSRARRGRRASMCRQADYLQPDCLLFSDKCSAINEFCVTRRSANAAIAMATRTPDHNRLPQGDSVGRERESRAGTYHPEWTYPLLLDADWGKASPLSCTACADATEDKSAFLTNAGMSWDLVWLAPDPLPTQGQIGVKSLYPGGLSLFALRLQVEPRTKQLPHVPTAHKGRCLRLGRDADD